MERKAFTFLRSFYEAACELTDKELQADFLMAICNYGLNGKEPELSGEFKAMFILIKPVLDVSLMRAEAGSAGGRGNRKKLADESNFEADKEKEYEKEDEKEKGVKKIDADFETFWKEYPRKTGKGDAKRAFKKALQKGATLESLVSAVRRQKCGSQWTRDGGQYIPHPATWLNQERWEDEVDGGIGNGNAGQYQEAAGSKWNLQTDDLSD